MTINETLVPDNFLIYAASCYNNKSCHSSDEFFEDLQRIKYVKKLVTRYVQTGELREKLILNHLIVLKNVFGSIHLSRMLYLKMGDHLRFVAPFLRAMHALPRYIHNVKTNGSCIDTNSLDRDDGVELAVSNMNDMWRRINASV